MTIEFPSKGFGDLLEALLEEKDLRVQIRECRVVVGCEKFPPKNRNVNLNSVEPTGKCQERNKDQL